MTSLTLTALFINLLSTGSYVTAQSNSRAATYANLGEVKHHSGGRQRAVTAVGEQGTFTFNLIDVPTATVDTLREWKGQAVQVRDDRGRIFTGVYFDTPTAEVPDRKTSYNVAISLRTVTAVEGV